MISQSNLTQNFKFYVDEYYRISDVQIINDNTWGPLNSQFYFIKSFNELFIRKSNSLPPGNVKIEGISGVVKIPDQSIIVTGLDLYPDATLEIYNVNDRSIPVKTISYPLIWDGTDENDNAVIPGVYQLTIKLNDGSNKKYNGQIIIK